MTATAETARLAARREALTGIGLMVVAMLVVPSMDALAKYLSQRLPALEIAFARFVGQAVLSGLIGVALVGPAVFRPPRLPLHMLRGLCLALATLLFFTAIRVMPLTDAIAVFFVEPMILTALSAAILKERVEPQTWAACLVGFAGALIIVRPSWSVFGVTALLPLGTAALFAGYLLITRQLSGQGSLWAAQFMTGLSGMAALGLALLATTLAGVEGAVAVKPQGSEWPLLAAVGVVSLITHGLVVQAFSKVPPQVLAPFNYLEIVSATALGYLVFGDFPQWPTWIGIALIVASGLFIVEREHARGRRKAAG